MIRAERIWRMQRFSGLVAMVLLAMALLALFDGLRGGIFGSSGQIGLVPGERYALSGPLPPKTDRIEDFIIQGGAPDGTLRLVPEGIFTGYMFGGGMWRGHLTVASHAGPGTYEIRVRDRFGEKQNPALVFHVRVFAGDEDRQAASPSLVKRRTAIEPLWLAGAFGMIGLIVGCGNYLLGKTWHRVLVEHGCGEVFRLKNVDGRLEATADMGAALPEGTACRFTRPIRGDLGFGTVVSCGNGHVTLHVRDNAQVRPGDIVCPVTV